MDHTRRLGRRDWRMRCRWPRCSGAYEGVIRVRMVPYIDYFYNMVLGTAGRWERMGIEEESVECRRRRSLLVAPGGSTVDHMIEHGVN